MRKIVGLAVLFTLAFLLTGCTTSSEEMLSDTTESNTTEAKIDDVEPESAMVDEVVYPHDEVIEVNIDINTQSYQLLIENAMDEEYYLCDITYNGYTLNDVAIRAKGNSSLRDVYNSGGDRFSYNIDLNYYEDQDLFGIDKLILNNLFKDPTMMVEYLTYEALDSLDVASSRTTFVALSINDEYYGLYLSVEHVSNEFLDANFGNSDGEQYKPDIGVGANLNYISDYTDYSALVDENSDDLTNEAIIELMERIESGENLEEVFNVESFLKYLAVSTYTVSLDGYQGGMFHNYYLYNNDGVFEWIAWDLNMAFNGFIGIPLTDEAATEYLINEPVVNSMSDYPLIESILDNETYLEQYHTYLQELIDGYFDYDTFYNRIIEVEELIGEFVESDTNSFFSYTEFQTAVFTTLGSSYSILQFVEERTVNVENQLSGLIPSTNNGQGNIVEGNSGPPRRLN
jgi:spore coat protein CotH